jgi:hypothetical protein
MTGVPMDKDQFDELTSILRDIRDSLWSIDDHLVAATEPDETD